MDSPKNTIDLSSLKKNKQQNNLFDLFIQSFVNTNNNLLVIFVSRKYEMRLDLLCSDLYGSVEYIGSLMKINDIFNPFSIKLGDIIFYIRKENITDSAYRDPIIIAQQKEELVNALKATTISNDRLDFLNSLKRPINLPPTITRTDAPKIVVENNNIQIAPNLFTNPNTNLESLQTDDTGLGNIFVNLPNTPQTEDKTERVLISKFIRSGNTVIATNDTKEENTNN